MQFEVERAGEAATLRVNVSKLTYPVLTAFFLEARTAVAAGARILTVDMAAVTYIDSATIGCLVEIHRLLEDHAGSVTLTGLHRRVETMITMTGVHKFLNICRPFEPPRESPLRLFGAGEAVPVAV